MVLNIQMFNGIVFGLQHNFNSFEPLSLMYCRHGSTSIWLGLKWLMVEWKGNYVGINVKGNLFDVKSR